MMWLWCWLRRAPVGCYSDHSRASNSTGWEVGCWRWKAALGARKGFITMSSEALKCWCKWRVKTWAFANALVFLVLMTSYFSVSSTTCPCNSWTRKAAEIFNYPVTRTYTQIRLFWIHLRVVDTNACLVNRLLYRSIPITTAFIPHDCATEHRYIIAYWYHMSDNTYL